MHTILNKYSINGITNILRSIFLVALYFIKSRRRTRTRRIQITFSGIRALAVPFLRPGPVCLPFRRAMAFNLTRAREWTATGFRMIRPSLTNLRMF